MSASNNNNNNNNTIETKYDTNATQYSLFLSTPLGQLEQSLFSLCIPRCIAPPTSATPKKFTVLDLGGGTGLRALDALRSGAGHVDIIDISSEMMRVGQEQLFSDLPQYKDRVCWYQADASRCLDHLEESLFASSGGAPYDLVIANGLFDHARNESELRMMWFNTARFLKIGGQVVANRNNPLAKSGREREGKYGVVLSDFRPFAAGSLDERLDGGENSSSTSSGGLEFRYRMMTQPPLEFQSIALDIYYKGSWEVPGEFFEGFQYVPWQETEVVKADPEFWTEYLEDPILYIFTATKKK